MMNYLFTYSTTLQFLKDLGCLTFERFLCYVGIWQESLVGLSQGLCLQSTTQLRKIWTNIHASSRIQTRNASNCAVKVIPCTVWPLWLARWWVTFLKYVVLSDMIHMYVLWLGKEKACIREHAVEWNLKQPFFYFWRPAPKNEDEMMIAIFDCIDRLFRIVRPRKLLYMAIDGVVSTNFCVFVIIREPQ
jgi:hypothetical protein